MKSEVLENEMPNSNRSELAKKAHQLNNLLGVIQGYADLLLMDLAPGDERAELVREIMRASDKASAVTADLPKAC